MKMIKCVCTFAVLVMGCMSVPLSSVRVQGPFHRPEIRAHVGIPSIAVSPVNGRMWATWYNGEHRGADYLNYVTLATSADGGKHWNEVLVADPDEDGPKRSFDPELWIAPDGQQTPDGSIVVIYDRSRLRDKEILFAKFTEDDVLAGKGVSGRMSLRNIVTSGNILR